jgi:hypothetical protein
MPAERVSMRRVREILRLKFECGRSDRAIAVSVSVARSTVQPCLARFAAAELSWPLPAMLSESGLEALLFARLGGSEPGKRHKAEPDWTVVHHELRRPGVTLLLLWEKYRSHPHQGLRLQPLVRATRPIATWRRIMARRSCRRGCAARVTRRRSATAGNGWRRPARVGSRSVPAPTAVCSRSCNTDSIAAHPSRAAVQANCRCCIRTSVVPATIIMRQKPVALHARRSLIP